MVLSDDDAVGSEILPVLRIKADSKLRFTVTGMPSSDVDDSVLDNGESVVINPLGELLDASIVVGITSPDVVEEETPTASPECNNGRKHRSHTYLVKKDTINSHKSDNIHVFILFQWYILSQVVSYWRFYFL